jgi:hypothetical protein
MRQPDIAIRTTVLCRATCPPDTLRVFGRAVPGSAQAAD